MEKIPLKKLQEDLRLFANQAEIEFRIFRDFQNEHGAHFAPGKLDVYDEIYKAYRSIVQEIINEGPNNTRYEAFKAINRRMLLECFWSCTAEPTMPVDVEYLYEEKRHKVQGPFTGVNNVMAFLHKEEPSKARTL